MATLQKFRAHESLNVDTAAGWDVQDRLTISSAAHVTSDVSAANQICIESESEILFRFDSSTSDTISANNDPTIPANTLVFLKVPRGVGDTIIFHAKQATSASAKYLKIVHM
tara:strand:+ start:2395 stop:2730 length:336 start_codon:yes stop_codon:yes gene_type:complete